jgi:hypothetical protein
MNAAAAAAAELTGPGFCRVAAADIRTRLGLAALGGWAEFAASWNGLDLDEYMADGGRYRRRRYACFTVAIGVARRQPHRPHYQGRGYNALNGGVDRWFTPVDERIGTHPVLLGLLAIFGGRFSAAAGPTSTAPSWLVEMHQFRIEADPRHAGQPTPEGMHRDGIDWVAVTLVGRNNVAGGVTAVADETGRTLGSFMLESPLDTVLLDDHRVWHGVTPVHQLDSTAPAHRDVLVLTFRDQRAR